MLKLTASEEESLSKLPKIEQILVKTFLTQLSDQKEKVDIQSKKLDELQNEIHRRKDSGELLSWEDVFKVDYEMNILENLLEELRSMYNQVEVV
ncbi:hypothetical protein MLC52_10875 [Sulfurimonas sp. NW15]|uniref:hypothetical protein n=1 Tax=Sulfurimonas sp. NW15 TaxID=2922729 RepID=UPI003DA9A106